MVTTASLAGLYFVTDEYGPAAGRVSGKLGIDTVAVEVLSEAEPWRGLVSVSRLLGWELFESERDAVKSLAKKVRECHQNG